MGCATVCHGAEADSTGPPAPTVEGLPEIRDGQRLPPKGCACSLNAMMDVEFRQRVEALKSISYREDFEASLYDLYASCEAGHRDVLRSDLKAGRLKSPMAWKNPTDYFRSDLTPEQKCR